MSNLNYNKVILGGRLTEEPELKHTPQEIPVVSFSLAVNRKGTKGDNKITDFFLCQAWRTTAENISRYFHKGNSIIITGSVYQKKYTDKNGANRTMHVINVDDFGFVDAYDKAQKTDAGQNVNPYMSDPSDYTQVPDDDLPF
jgi:single-strand DNA-binding protein